MNYQGKAVPISEEEIFAVKEQEKLKRQEELLAGQTVPLPSETAFVQQNRVVVTPRIRPDLFR